MDLHNHSTSSDGRHTPLQMIRRALELDLRAFALTDHVDATNVERVVTQLVGVAGNDAHTLPITFLPGCEITSVAPEEIADLAHRAKRAGARIVIVHGETLAGGALPGTNHAAVRCADVDVLAHPGLVTLADARRAAKNGIFLEISGDPQHAVTNGHVAKIARLAGAKLIVDSDAHRGEDLLTPERARLVALGAGLEPAEIERALVENPRELVRRVS
jgi:histidinol phosphatase-like PHP family hydrolase